MDSAAVMAASAAKAAAEGAAGGLGKGIENLAGAASTVRVGVSSAQVKEGFEEAGKEVKEGFEKFGKNISKMFESTGGGETGKRFSGLFNSRGGEAVEGGGAGGAVKGFLSPVTAVRRRMGSGDKGDAEGGAAGGGGEEVGGEEELSFVDDYGEIPQLGLGGKEFSIGD
jgi:hypothetical protein